MAEVAPLLAQKHLLLLLVIFYFDAACWSFLSIFLGYHDQLYSDFLDVSHTLDWEVAIRATPEQSHNFLDADPTKNMSRSRTIYPQGVL